MSQKEMSIAGKHKADSKRADENIEMGVAGEHLAHQKKTDHGKVEVERLTNIDIIRICLTPVWIGYAIALCIRMKDLSWSKANSTDFIVISALWFFAVLVMHVAIVITSIRC